MRIVAHLLALAALSSLAITLVPARAEAARVLLVSDAGADLGIADALRSDGHSVVVASGDFATGNATLLGDLAPYDLVVWSATGSGYGDAHPDSRVFANLAAFVDRGGRVLVTGYDTVASPTDQLLIEFLGGTGSTDVPGPPGPITTLTCSLTAGVVDVRGVVPSPMSGDRDTLTGLYGGTLEIVGTSNGGGSQWTLRPLGRGEIAYVSNGDAGAVSTASWTMVSSDGSGVYNAALRNFAAAAGVGSVVAQQVASGGSPRRARAMYLMDAPSPAVLVSESRAWIPPGVAIPLSICAGACHPVVETRECAAPECPGQGTLLITRERIADVPELPHDRVGFTNERALLMADPELASISWAFGQHPEPPPAPPSPVRFLRPREQWIGWELHFEGAFGVEAAKGIPIGTVSASIGLRFQPRDIDDPLDVMYGNIHGFDLRATVVPGFDGQNAGDLAVLVGVAPGFGYAFANDRIRIPPAFAFLIPEVGIATGTSQPTSFYATWHLAADYLLDEHVGLEVRGDVTIIDAWAGGDVATLLSLGAGIFFR